MEAKDVILKAIEYRTSDNPINNAELAQLCQRYGFNISTERVREEIRFMRKDGILILSVASAGGGYYMSRSMDDYLKFRNTNLLPRVIDMQDTIKLMDYAAKQEYKMDAQARLF